MRNFIFQSLCLRSATRLVSKLLESSVLKGKTVSFYYKFASSSLFLFLLFLLVWAAAKKACILSGTCPFSVRGVAALSYFLRKGSFFILALTKGGRSLEPREGSTLIKLELLSLVIFDDLPLELFDLEPEEELFLLLLSVLDFWGKCLILWPMIGERIWRACKVIGY